MPAKHTSPADYSGSWALDLANAIVADAAREYRALRKRLVVHRGILTDSQIAAIEKQMAQLEAFFTEWLLGEILTRGLGPVILEKLKEEKY